MISTDKFVFLHFPKTGGTFVTSVLEELSDLLGPHRVLAGRSPATWFRRLQHLKHTTRAQVPRGERGKQIVGNVRNPYDLYVSEYEFAWWKRPEYSKYFARLVPHFRHKYPGYPALNFEEFLRLYHEAFCVWPSSKRLFSDHGIGWLTQRFIWFYARRPLSALLRARRGIAARQAISWLEPMRFLRTHCLNRDLYDLLLDLGYPEDRLRFILSLGRRLPAGKGRLPDQKWRNYYTPRIKQAVRRKDRLLFELFPEFDL